MFFVSKLSRKYFKTMGPRPEKDLRFSYEVGLEMETYLLFIQSPYRILDQFRGFGVSAIENLNTMNI